MTKTYAALLVGAALLVPSLAHAQDIKLMTGPQGGSWYPLGGAIKSIVENNVDGTSVQVLPGGGIANVKGVETDRTEMAFANSVSTVDALRGNAPFDSEAQNVCNVATLYPQFYQMVALQDAGIDAPGNYEDQALTTQPRGNTGEAATVHVLEAAGLTYDDMEQVSYGSYNDSVNLMKDGNADVFTLVTTVPAGAILDLASARNIRMVPIDDELLSKLQEINSGYKRAEIPAGSYPGQDEAVPTIGWSTHLVAQCDLDEQFVYDVLTAINDNASDLASIAQAVKGLDPQRMAQDVGVPMHAGAEKFYQEQGVM